MTFGILTFGEIAFSDLSFDEMTFGKMTFGDVTFGKVLGNPINESFRQFKGCNFGIREQNNPIISAMGH